MSQIPGTSHAYHAFTYGWLVGELIRRVAGESVGAFVRRRLAELLGLRLWIGLPPAGRDRVAWLLAPLPDTDRETAAEVAAALAVPPSPDRDYRQTAAGPNRGVA